MSHLFDHVKVEVSFLSYSITTDITKVSVQVNFDEKVSCKIFKQLYVLFRSCYAYVDSEYLNILKVNRDYVLPFFTFYYHGCHIYTSLLER